MEWHVLILFFRLQIILYRQRLIKPDRFDRYDLLKHISFGQRLMKIVCVELLFYGPMMR